MQKDRKGATSAIYTSITRISDTSIFYILKSPLELVVIIFYVEAFSLIAKNQALFISRGDDSGTNKLEINLWQQAKIKPAGAWYQETGAGMGQTLQVANEKYGYTLADRATYIFQKQNLSLPILVEGDPKLLNLYHVMEVNPNKFTRVNTSGAKAFSDFLLSPEGQKVIADHGKAKFGQALFFVDAGKTEKDYGL
ncbi:substrate-binding domain-containing protein [Sphaerospermopsis torques-reginae]|uniref:substrate-binding domain-containing protein n=1 Tax=Sphaerospermopsis torques-reginae TaxID=984207 RepID=UPI001FE8B8C1|nr:substrate-binding domain-containing protein [Sphaerospermopsis torques-reginae]